MATVVLKVICQTRYRVVLLWCFKIYVQYNITVNTKHKCQLHA